MIERSLRPRLADKARLRFDSHSGRHVLMYPERGLVLNDTAARILLLCTGEHTVAAIADALTEDRRERARVEHDTLVFLHTMIERGLVRCAR
jgi:coenzyme PQQ biosynthesis protein PqqD